MLYYPQDIQNVLGVGKLYSKTFKTKKEAKEAKEAKDAEIDFYASIKDIRENKDKWLDTYISGLTSTNVNPPTAVTVSNTQDVFRLHILPMFGKPQCQVQVSHSKKGQRYLMFRSFVASI